MPGPGEVLSSLIAGFGVARKARQGQPVPEYHPELEDVYSEPWPPRPARTSRFGAGLQAIKAARQRRQAARMSGVDRGDAGQERRDAGQEFPGPG
jgi:hypothetical protein